MNGEELTRFDYIFFGAWFGLSFALLLGWLVRTNGVREAFASAPSKEHCWGGMDMLVLALVYVVNGGALAVISWKLGGDENLSWEKQNVFLMVFMGGQVLITGIILYLARKRFAAGWKGLGVTAQKPVETAVWSVIYFVAATGLTLLILSITVYISERAGYAPQKHEILEKLGQEGTPLLSIILMVLSAAIGAPVMEEMLFRGALQNYLVRFFSQAHQGQGDKITPVKETAYGRWVGIFIAAVVFALFHANIQHMPALVVLGVCMGYAYERYGNLLIPIVVHSLFNMLPLTLTLLGK
jgi:membrane protease YdiL (CAAX protease family)